MAPADSKGLKIAVCGKGGVGKTTVCAVWARLFAADGFDVLALDADSDTNLAAALGLTAGTEPQPLIGLRDLIAERTGTDPGTPAAYFRLNPEVADLPAKYWLEVPTGPAKGTLKLLVLGAITRAGTGCACPEAAFLKAMLGHAVLHRNELVLVDLAAGVEFMGRAAVEGIDALVAVVEPGSRSIETAKSIAQMARELGIKHTAAVVNKIRTPEEAAAVKNRLEGMAILAEIRYSDAIQRADLQRKDVFAAGGELVDSLKRAGNRLAELAGTAGN
jgi:CO dehydrogenase maturation factor